MRCESYAVSSLLGLQDTRCESWSSEQLAWLPGYALLVMDDGVVSSIRGLQDTRCEPWRGEHLIGLQDMLCESYAVSSLQRLQDTRWESCCSEHVPWLAGYELRVM